MLDLKPLLDGVYERASCGVRMDDGAALKPGLSAENQVWWEQLQEN